MGKNIDRFASIMSNQMKKTSNAAIPTTIELGTVNADLSITSDSLRDTIPVGDYMINLMLTGEHITEAAGDHGGHETGTAGEHSHQLPSTFRCLQSGDRVLIAWCGNDPIVIAIVVSS